MESNGIEASDRFGYNSYTTTHLLHDSLRSPLTTRCRLIPHPGVFRHVSEYVLRSAKISPDMEKVIGIEREGDRVRRIAVEGVKKFKEKHGGEGFFRDDNRGYRGKKRRRKGGHETLRRPKIRRSS